MAERKILVVDDDEVMLGVIGDSLRSHGYEVETAVNAMDALQAIHRTAAPDLVITDVRMPGVDGLELIKRLRTNRRTTHIPIIALSSRKAEEEIIAGYTVGADEYVTKQDLRIPVLVRKVEAILRRARPPTDEEPDTHRGRVILFLHGKGGVGATTLAVNTAVALVLGGSYPVATLDLDLAFGNVPLLLNLVPRYTLADLSEASIAEADDTTFRQIINDRHESNVWVIAGCDTPERSELVSPTVVEQAIERLRTRAEFIVVDTDPSFSEINLAVIDSADLICVVGAPQLPALKATADCMDLLRKLGVPDSRVLFVLNQTAPRGLDDKQVGLFLNRIKHSTDLTVPYTQQYEEAANTGRPFITAFPTSAASREMSDFAAKMVLAATAEAEDE